MMSPLTQLVVGISPDVGSSIAVELGLIEDHYGEDTAKLNHIYEGLHILSRIGAGVDAMAAYCIHPLLQSDEDLARNAVRVSQVLAEWGAPAELSTYRILLATEYRSVAQEYLSHREIASVAEIRLSPLAEVNQMLIADKVQNFSDFLIRHAQNHPRSSELQRYFLNWLERLDAMSTFLDHHGRKFRTKPRQLNLGYQTLIDPIASEYSDGV